MSVSAFRGYFYNQKCQMQCGTWGGGGGELFKSAFKSVFATLVKISYQVCVCGGAL